MRLISPLRKNWTILEDIFGGHNREDMTTGAKNGQKLKDILQCTEQNSSTHTKDHLTENVNMVRNSIAWQLSMATPSLSKFYILSVLCECVNECVCGGEEYVYICICACTHVGVRGQLSGWFSAIPGVLGTELKWSGLQQQAPSLWAISRTHESLYKETFKNIITL